MDKTIHVSRRWHICADCKHRVYVSKRQSWRAAQPRCMGCGSGRLLTVDEAKTLGVEEKK